MTLVQTLYGFALPHALVGTVALVTFWTAGLTRKGSPVHRGAGKIYLLAMIGVIVTAVPLTLAAALEEQWASAVFLAYLIVLVSHACRLAWLAIRWKRDFQRYTGPGYRISAASVTVAGLAVVIVGVFYNAWLLIIFGLIGPLGGLEARNLVRKGPQGPKWWLKEHYGAMIGNGVATHIAFLQIGLMRLIPGLGDTMIQHLAWFGPLALGIAAGYWLDHRYMRPRPTPARHGLGHTRP